MNDICNIEEWLAAYLDKRLTEEERLRCESHLSRCPHCLAELIAAKTDLDEMIMEEAEGAKAPGRFEAGRASAPGIRWGIPAPPRLASLAFRRLSVPVILTASLSIVAALILAGWLFHAVFTPGRGSAIVEARATIATILEATDLGDMRLSNGAARPVVHSVIYRGADAKMSGLMEQTKKTLASALAEHKDDWRLYALLGDLYIADSQIERADNYYAQALRLNPGNASLLNDRAVAAYRLGQFDLSRQHLESALATDGSRLETLYNLAVLSRETGDREALNRWIASYLQRDPSSPWAERARDLAAE